MCTCLCVCLSVSLSPCQSASLIRVVPCLIHCVVNVFFRQHVVNFVFETACSCIYLSTDACGEHFSFADVITFPRPKSEPIITAAAPPMPVMRQPRYDPDVLGHGAQEARTRDGMIAARQQPRASNASVSSLTVSRQVHPVSKAPVSQATLAGRQAQPVRDNPLSQVPPTGRQAQPVRDNLVSQVSPTGHQAQPVRDNPVSQVSPTSHQAQPVRDNPVSQAPPAVVGKSYHRSVL